MEASDPGRAPDKEKEPGFLGRLGPGLVTGAADDDPSGIGTHSQVGAEFGYALSWTFVLSFPLMVVIQTVAAQIGRVTGAGIALNLRRHYPRPLLWSVVALLLVIRGTAPLSPNAPSCSRAAISLTCSPKTGGALSCVGC